MKINLAHIAVGTDVLGPGRRVIIWVQGCPRRCKNCITLQMQPFIEKELIEPASLADKILAYDDIEGITLSGGEPLQQAQGLSEMIELLQSQEEHVPRIRNPARGRFRPSGRRASDLSVFTYTGYTLQRIQEKNDFWWNRLLSLSDILVDGEYIEELACDLLWRGSSNQKMYFLTDRYRHLELLQHHRGRYLLFDVTQEGDVIMIGIPSPSFYKEFTDKLDKRGVQLNDISVSKVYSNH